MDKTKGPPPHNSNPRPPSSDRSPTPAFSDSDPGCRPVRVETVRGPFLHWAGDTPKQRHRRCTSLSLIPRLRHPPPPPLVACFHLTFNSFLVRQHYYSDTNWPSRGSRGTGVGFIKGRIRKEEGPGSWGQVYCFGPTYDSKLCSSAPSRKTNLFLTETVLRLVRGDYKSLISDSALSHPSLSTVRLILWVHPTGAPTPLPTHNDSIVNKLEYLKINWQKQTVQNIYTLK